MAITASVTWDIIPGTLYVVTYKKLGETTWITPPGNPTQSVPFIINNVDACSQYDFKIEADCGILTFQGTVPCPKVTNLEGIPI